MYPISDMLNRIINAQKVLRPVVEVPFSNLKYEIAKILEKSGFVEKIEKKGRKTNRSLEIILRYQEQIPAISGVKMISKPGQRIYLDFRKIKKVKGGFGMAIISTSKGLMTNKEARKQKIGGEVICEIW